MLVRSPLLTSHKWRELVPPGRLVLLRFRLYAFVEVAALRSIVLRYAGASIATRVFFFFFGDVVFSEYFLYHFRFLFVVWTIEYVVHSFLPNGVFLPCDHGLDF